MDYLVRKDAVLPRTPPDYAPANWTRGAIVMPSILELYGRRDDTLFGADSRNIVRRLERLELFRVLVHLDVDAGASSELSWRATRRSR